MAITDSATLVARLRDLLSYDPSTGILRWRIGKGNVIAGSIAGGLNDQGYILLRVDRVAMRAHRVAWAIVTGSFPALELDHKNRIRSDNRWANLREVSHAQNFENVSLRKDCRHGFRGVEQHSSGLWRAALVINKKRIRSGYFKTPQEAATARQALEEKYFKHQRIS